MADIVDTVSPEAKGLFGKLKIGSQMRTWGLML